MSLRRLPLLTMLAAALLGCASSSMDLIPVPGPEGAMKISDDGPPMLQVQVQNQGLTPVESSPVAILFFLPTATVKSAIQNGGPLQPGEASAVLEFEIPKDCLDGGCEFQVSVDPENALQGENRSNNLVLGHCEGQIASRSVNPHETDRPRVQ